MFIRNINDSLNHDTIHNLNVLSARVFFFNKCVKENKIIQSEKIALTALSKALKLALWCYSV